MNSDRYTGKPFLRLLELYVLWSIGELTSIDFEMLQAITPQLRKTYDCEGEWHDIIAVQMSFPESFPKMIQVIWEKQKEYSNGISMPTNAALFAVRFVDVNFPN